MATSEAKKVDKPMMEMLTQLYDEVVRCSNGFFNVKRHVRYGYLNELGEQITPIKYDSPADFKNGYATVKYNRSYFRVDENGEEVEI